MKLVLIYRDCDGDQPQSLEVTDDSAGELCDRLLWAWNEQCKGVTLSPRVCTYRIIAHTVNGTTTTFVLMRQPTLQ